MRSGRTIAKLSPPRLFDAVARPRLFEALDRALLRPLLLVSGAPGTGKTTLVASYLEARRRRTIWYHVDGGDEDPASFFFFLHRAAGRATRRSAELSLLTPEYLGDIEGFARRFFRTLFAVVPPATVLTLDNLHAIADDNVLHTILVAATREVPPGSAIVLISRRGPRAGYTHLLANDLAVHLDGEALLFTHDETHALVTRKYRLPPQAGDSLYARTRGWAAGVALLAQQWRMESGAIASDRVSMQSVADYFATEIMQPLSPHERGLLMRTALLPTVMPASAVTLTGDDTTGILLDKLYRRRLFTERQAGDGPRYRYHDMFREFLLDSLRASLPAGEHAQLLRAAARIALDAGETEAAMPLLLQTGDVDSASEVIRQHAQSLLAAGRFRTVHGWIEALGEAALESRPWLRYWLGRALMPIDTALAGRTLTLAYEQFRKTGDAAGQLLSAAQMINVYYYAYVDYAPMASWAARIDALLADGAVLPDATSEADLCTALIFAETWLGQVKEPGFKVRAEQLLRDPSLDPNIVTALGHGLVDFYTVGSRMADARRVIENLRPAIENPRVTALNRAYAHLTFGYCYLRAGEPAAAERSWGIADQLTAVHGLTQTDFVVRMFRTYLKSSLLDVMGAQAQMQGLETLVTDDQPLFGALFHVGGVLLELARGDGAAAARHARLSLRHATRLGGRFVNVAWRAHGSAALAMAAEHDEAARWIEEGLEQAEGSWLECYRTNLLMSRAYSLLLQGERDRAHMVIGEMLRLARDMDWWTYLRIVPNVKDVVIREAIHERIELPFAQRLVREFRVRPGPEPGPDWPWTVKVHTLGEFRVEVNGTALMFSRKAQRRPLGMLKVLIALGGSGVDAQHLAAELWPASEGDSADDALMITAHRLRRLLCDENALVIRDGKCSLNLDLVWVDVWDLERQLDLADTISDAWTASGVDTLMEMLLETYRGHFLEREAEEAWMLPIQQRLKARVQRALAGVGQYLEHAQRWDVATTVYERGIALDPLAETFYRRLMLCHCRCGRLAEASEVFRRCRHMLSVMLGAKPSADTLAVFESLASR